MSSINYSYDGDGIRLRAAVEDQETTTYLWDQNAALPQLAVEERSVEEPEDPEEPPDCETPENPEECPPDEQPADCETPENPEECPPEEEPTEEIERREYHYGNELISMSAGTESQFFHRDALGSITGITSADGVKQWTYSYEPFGALRSETKHEPDALVNSIGFTGAYHDSATGLYHLRARQSTPAPGGLPPPTRLRR